MNVVTNDSWFYHDKHKFLFIFIREFFALETV